MRLAIQTLGLILIVCLTACSFSTPSPQPQMAVHDQLADDRLETEKYKITIHYPELADNEALLAQALQADIRPMQKDFLDAVTDMQSLPEHSERQYWLELDCRQTSRTASLTSVVCTGTEDTGGAHPMPLNFSKTLDTRSRRMLSLGDLFADAQTALQLFSDEARHQLQAQLIEQADLGDASPQTRQQALANMRDMLHQGTTAEADNFQVFAVAPEGIRLIFPPYQVAPYVAGAHSVQVPAAVFQHLLRREYQTAFEP